MRQLWYFLNLLHILVSSVYESRSEIFETFKKNALQNETSAYYIIEVIFPKFSSFSSFIGRLMNDSPYKDSLTCFTTTLFTL